MAPKTKIAKPAAAAGPAKLTYKDMINSAIIALKERTGSSRQAIKKYVQSNYNIKAGNFDSLFNTALRKGVETGDFLQPKGPSGPVKVAKKEKPVPKVAKVAKVAKVTKKPVAKKPAAKKVAAAKKVTKKTTVKKAVKAAPKKVTKKATTTKKAAPKKAAPKKSTK
ncbi:linker histone H1 and H5 family-domain-containing protein [Scheffersomyces amazonensis]|uniref:linker histone H1 and H5 family-domain-containing protein n=1 Tax=Scheffersomyces amazonensis TaxID=1078765 RepID=UPI00315C696F